MSDQGDGFQVSQKEKNKNQVAHGKVCREHRQQDEHWEVAIISSHFNACVKEKTILKEIMVFVPELDKTKWGVGFPIFHHPYSKKNIVQQCAKGFPKNLL